MAPMTRRMFGLDSVKPTTPPKKSKTRTRKVATSKDASGTAGNRPKGANTKHKEPQRTEEDSEEDSEEVEEEEEEEADAEAEAPPSSDSTELNRNSEEGERGLSVPSQNISQCTTTPQTERANIEAPVGEAGDSNESSDDSLDGQSRHDESPGRSPNSSVTAGHFIHISVEALRNLRVQSKHVGHTKRHGRWVKAYTHKLATKWAKDMISVLKNLNSLYKNLNTAKSTDDQSEVATVEKEIYEITHRSLPAQKNAFTSMFEESAADDRNIDGELTALLLDFYFDIVPTFLIILRTCVQIQFKTSVREIALSDFEAISCTLIELAEFALGRPKEIQPRYAKINITYHIMQPTSRLKKKLVEMHQEAEDKLSAIKKARESAIEGSRKEAKRKAEKERVRQKVMEVERRKVESWNKLQSQLQQKVAERDAVFQRNSQRYQSLTTPTSTADPFGTSPTNDGDDPFSEDYNPGANSRSHHQPRPTPQAATQTGRTAQVDSDSSSEGFPADNVRYDSSRDEWLDEEQKIFIAIMKNHAREYRTKYNLAAERLSRSMDEVIEKAKELQELMDQKHREGEFVTGFEWTYDIWRETESERV